MPSRHYVSHSWNVNQSMVCLHVLYAYTVSMYFDVLLIFSGMPGESVCGIRLSSTIEHRYHVEFYGS